MTTATTPSRPPAHLTGMRPSSNSATAHFRTLTVDELHEFAEKLPGRPVPGVRMTESEFVAWCDEDVRAEWVGGEVFIMSPSNVEHDDLQIWLIRLLGEYVEAKGLGTINQNIFVRFSQQHRRRVPDLIFTAKKHLDRIKPTYLHGAPDFVIEIISPDSQSRDRRDKFFEYEKAGVGEYWIIDPLSKTVELYGMHRKKFRLITNDDGIARSKVLEGFKLKTAQLWQKPLPKVSGVLRQMAKL